MNYTKKQLKQINNLSKDYTPAQIASKLRLSKKDVERVIAGWDGVGQSGIIGHSVHSLIPAATWWLLFALIVLSPLVFFKGIYDFANLPQAAVVQTGALLACLLLTLSGRNAGGLRLIVPPVSYPLATFLLWALLSLFWAYNDYEGIATWQGWAAPFLIFFVVTWLVAEDKRRARWLLAGLFVTGALVAIIGIGQHLFAITFIPQAVAPAATFANKNMAVHILILTLPLGLIFFIGARKRYTLWGSVILWVVMASYLFYTKTRAGWVAYALQCIVAAVFLLKSGMLRQWRWRRAGGAAALLAIFCVLVAVNLGPDGFHWRLGAILDRVTSIVTHVQDGVGENNEPGFEEPGGGPDSAEGPGGRYTSAELRIEIWINTMEMIKENPVIGLGLGNHKIHYPLYHSRKVKEKAFSEGAQLVNVHNDYLQIWTEVGTVGMLFLGWFLIAVGLLFRRLLNSTVAYDDRLMGMGMGIAILGILVNAIFCFPFHRTIPPVVMMTYLGIAAGLAAHYKGSKTVSLSKGILAAGAVFFLVATLVMAWYQLRLIEADRYYLALTQLEAASNWQGVVATGRESIRLDSFRKKTLSYVGRAYVEMGQFQQGIDTLNEVLDAYPYHMNALLNLGVAYGGLKEYDKAIETYQRVIAIKDDYAKVHNNMGNVYMDKKEFNRALDEFRIAARIEPTNAVMNFNGGVAAMQLNLHEEAANYFAKAVALNPDWSLAQKNLGIVYHQYLHREQEGLRHLRKAILLDPKISDADQIRRILETAPVAE